jgi:hypothetical protein
VQVECLVLFALLVYLYVEDISEIDIPAGKVEILGSVKQKRTLQMDRRNMRERHFGEQPNIDAACGLFGISYRGIRF